MKVGDIAIVKYEHAQNLLDLDCDITVSDVRDSGLLKRKSKSFAKKLDEVIINNRGDELLGKALVYNDVKVKKIFAALFIELDYRTKIPNVDLNALRRSLIQVYNYMRVNNLKTMAISTNMCKAVKSNIKPIDIEMIVDDLFRHTLDVEIMILM